MTKILTINGLKPAAEIRQQPPKLSLDFHDYGVILTRYQANGETLQYAVDPNAVTEALGSAHRFETGLLSDRTLYVSQEGVRQVVIEYRPPEKTGLWLEDREEAFRIPLPGLILCRTTQGGSNAKFRVYAVTERPGDLKAKLFRAPLPNTGDDGICWGNVTRGAKSKDVDLKTGWDALLGSKFNSHGVFGKSKKHNADVRLMWKHLDRYGNKEYPLDDLVSTKKTLESLIEELNT